MIEKFITFFLVIAYILYLGCVIPLILNSKSETKIPLCILAALGGPAIIGVLAFIMATSSYILIVVLGAGIIIGILEGA